MRLYFAGDDGYKATNEILLRYGAKNRLESFFYLRKGNPSMQFENYLLDSGGFTARKSGVEIDIRNYIDFINKNSIKQAFNLDTNDLNESRKNQRILMQNTDAEIVPIYHATEREHEKTRDMLMQYIEEYNYIGISGPKRKSVRKEYKLAYFDFVFSHFDLSVRFHGLGITTPDFLRRYSWYSVDSTTWISIGKYGRASNLKIKQMQKYLAKGRRRNHNIERDLPYWIGLEKTMTKYWKNRDIDYS